MRKHRFALIFSFKALAYLLLSSGTLIIGKALLCEIPRKVGGHLPLIASAKQLFFLSHGHLLLSSYVCQCCWEWVFWNLLYFGMTLTSKMTVLFFPKQIKVESAWNIRKLSPTLCWFEVWFSVAIFWILFKKFFFCCHSFWVIQAIPWLFKSGNFIIQVFFPSF